MATVVIMAAVGLLAIAAAWWYGRSARPAPTGTPNDAPSQLDRLDFRAPDADWLIAVFTADSCLSCAAVWKEVAAYEDGRVVAENIEVSARPELHRRYAIDSVPTTVVADRSGRAALGIIGPLASQDHSRLRSIVRPDA